jgi:hypothetical protein
MFKVIPVPYTTHTTATTGDVFIPATGYMSTERISEVPLAPVPSS